MGPRGHIHPPNENKPMRGASNGTTEERRSTM